MSTTVISVRGKVPAVLLADPGFVYVGRRCAGWSASPWGNPFKVARGGLATDWRRVDRGWYEAEVVPHLGTVGYRSAVDLYQWWICANRDLVARLPELRGKALGCWCGDWQPGQPDIGCHAVVLARLADATPIEVEVSR